MGDAFPPNGANGLPMGIARNDQGHLGSEHLWPEVEDEVAIAVSSG